MSNAGFEKLDLAELESLSAVGGNDNGVALDEYAGSLSAVVASARLSFVGGMSVSASLIITGTFAFGCFK